MKALVKSQRAPGIWLEDVPEPKIGPNDVRIRIRKTAICGTDIHIVDDEFRAWPPVTMGHEVCGIVAEVGESVDLAWLGARVVSETYFSTCGVCGHCRAGRHNLCLDRRSIGSARERAEGDVGYIRIGTFSEQTYEGLRKGIEKLNAEIGADKLKGYIIDLRNNRGGRLDQSVLVSDAFRERGKIYAEVTGRLTESLAGVRVVKAYEAERREAAVFASGVA